MAIVDRLKGAWNAFRNSSTEDVSSTTPSTAGYAYSTSSPSRSRLQIYNDKYITTSIYTRISIDVAGVPFRHAKVDELERYQGKVDSSLNDCLWLEANIDQSPRALRQDLVLTLLSRGVAALVPVDTLQDPTSSEVFDIFTLRVGEIVGWFDEKVRVSVFNSEKQRREEVLLDKRFVAIVENPLYAVMNEPNSTLQRLIRKLSQLDAVDDQSSSGKLDIIIQLPYAIRSETRRNQAEQRREQLEAQLKGSQYGIAYADATEKITQLNRPAENNLMSQIEWLAKMLYGQLGITESVMDGTADEATMINYWNRTIEPIVEAMREAMQRSFIGPVGSKKSERILYFRDYFKLVPISQLAEIADKFTRNEILSSNEFRGIVGFAPSSDPKADQLVNSNMPQPAQTDAAMSEMDSTMNDVFDGLSSDIDALAQQAGVGSTNGSAPNG